MVSIIPQRWMMLSQLLSMILMQTRKPRYLFMCFNVSYYTDNFPLGCEAGNFWSLQVWQRIHLWWWREGRYYFIFLRLSLFISLLLFFFLLFFFFSLIYYSFIICKLIIICLFQVLLFFNIFINSGFDWFTYLLII